MLVLTSEMIPQAINKNLAHSLEECTVLSFSEYAKFCNYAIHQKATANIIARRCVDTWTGKIDALFKISNSINTKAAKIYVDCDISITNF